MRPMGLLIISVALFTTALDGWAYKIQKYEDEFEGVKIVELLDNNIAALKDGYELFLNIQKVKKNNEPDTYNFVIIYFSHSTRFKFKEDESFFILVGEGKLVFKKASGFDRLSQEYIGKSINDYEAAVDLSNQMYAAAGYPTRNPKYPSFYDIGVYPIEVDTLSKIVFSDDVKLKVVSENRDIIQVLDKNDLKDLKRFHKDFIGTKGM